MITDDRDFTPFERAVMEKLLHGDHPVLAALREQYRHCHVQERESTGVGFFTSIAVDRTAPRCPETSIQVMNVAAEIEGIANDAEFVLFVTEGYMDMLEGFTYDDPWPDVIRHFTLSYILSREKDPGNITRPPKAY